MNAVAILPRRPDWALQLDAFLASRLRTPFAWGANDCALFAADAVLAQTGQDLAAGLRGLNAREALRHVRAVGGMCYLVPDVLPALERTADAREGDIVLLASPIKAPKRLSFGVVGRNAAHALAPSRAGLLTVPMASAVQCWGVGHG